MLLLDEIDKMGADFRGDPASAMLEVLDPEQNTHFRDHYLDLPFDLSKVLFICTANPLDTIPGPLLDRMDVIQLSGYTEDEKLGIAQQVPRAEAARGARADRRSSVAISDGALRVDHPRVHARGRRPQPRAAHRRPLPQGRARDRRGQDREGSQSTSARRARGSGPRRFPADPRKRTADPGVATGLACTPVGGDVLFIEATAYPGKGKLTITGQLGEVMQESAQAALSWVRSHTRQLGLAGELVRRARRPHPRAGRRGPEGRAVGRGHDRDGDRRRWSAACRSPTTSAMTGEITLTGQVLPVGGVREKVLAAQRSGLKRVVLPRENEPDLEELPDRGRKELEFVLVDSIEEVLDGRVRPGQRARLEPSRAPRPERQAALPA